jgi:hypothetical protein
MSLIAELKQAMYDVPLINKSGRNKFAHFCEHDNIHIRFTKARSIWHAITPTAIKPWWIILEPVRTTNKTHINNTKNKNIETEVIDNA